MKTIILLGGYGTRMRPHTWSRPKPLLQVAGKPVLGHILDRMEELLTGEVIFVVGYLGDQVREWVLETYPDLDSRFIVQDEALGQAHAAWLCRDYLATDEPVALAFGDAIVDAPFEDVRATAANRSADAVFVVYEVEDPRGHGVVVLNEDEYVTEFIEKPQTLEHSLLVTGVNWFADGRQLLAAVETVMQEDLRTHGEHFMADAYEVMLRRGARITILRASQWSDAGQFQTILQTNARLLATGPASIDAIERSYGEDFTVLPPVYVHPDAQIDGSVIGPYVSIDAGARVSQSVLRNCIVDKKAEIEGAVLDGALIGERARVIGRGKGLFVGDDARVNLG